MNTNALKNEAVNKLFVKLTLPAVVAQLVNLLYNMVDRMYIGHIKSIGSMALTGIGVSMPILMLVSAFAVLVGAGGAPRASIMMGKGNKEEAEKILNNCTVALVVIGVFMTLILFVFRVPILKSFGASEDSIVYALEYLEIYLLGSIFVLITLGLNFFISAQGFATISMKTTLIGAGLNILLDPIFIFYFNMGVRGAALATIIAQSVSCFWVLRFLVSQQSTIRIKTSALQLNAAVLFPVMALGFSPFIMNSTESLLQITFNTSLAKYGGDLFVGTMSINSLVMQFVWLPLAGISQGATPIISYNYGSNNPKRVKEAILLLVKACLCYSVLLFLAIQIFPEAFITLFTKDQSLFEATCWTLRIYSAGIFMLGIQSACQQSFIAFGQAKISVFLALLRKIILLIPLIYLLPHLLENQALGVYLAEPIADIIAASVTGMMFYQFVKRILHEMKLPSIHNK